MASATTENTSAISATNSSKGMASFVFLVTGPVVWMQSALQRQRLRVLRDQANARLMVRSLVCVRYAVDRESISPSEFQYVVSGLEQQFEFAVRQQKPAVKIETGQHFVHLDL